MDYKNCVCRNSIVDRLVEECTNVIDENKIYNETLNTISSDDCASCFIYFHWYRKNKQLDSKKYVPDAKYSKTETLIY